MRTRSERRSAANEEINRLRREAREMWSLASPARQGLYISLRRKGATPEEAIAGSRGGIRGAKMSGPGGSAGAKMLEGEEPLSVTLAERVALSLLVAQVIGEGDTEWLEHRMEGEPYEFGREEISAALKSLRTKLRDDEL